MVFKKVVLITILLLFINGCSPSEKTLIKSDKELFRAENQACEEQGKVWSYNTKTREGACTEGTSDAGKRCTKTTDCEGFCEGSNESTSSGKCSKAFQAYSCTFIIERGERFWRCPK